MLVLRALTIKFCTHTEYTFYDKSNLDSASHNPPENKVVPIIQIICKVNNKKLGDVLSLQKSNVAKKRIG